MRVNSSTDHAGGAAAEETLLGVSAPTGFRATGLACGLKSSGAPDLALVLNDGPDHVAAGVFTSNRVQAAPVQWSRMVMDDGSASAVVLNSGGANACTGPGGRADTRKTATRAAELLGLAPVDVAVCSTGLIGQRLDMPALLAGLDKAAGALSTTGGPEAAEAIMTTDTHPKQAQAAGAGYVVGGMAKGAGMLAPALATMLVVLTTDAHLTPAQADAALRTATAATFDRIDSDGCQSTNDTVLLLASGASGTTPDPAEFTATLTVVCDTLARALIGDAEGASHDIAITVAGARDEAAALAGARAVARSNLFKAAVFGNDPNWGRILAALGTVPATVTPFEPDAVDVVINGIQVCHAGGVGEDRRRVDLAGARQVDIRIDLHAGVAQATVWTNDLTHDYVHENSAYST